VLSHGAMPYTAAEDNLRLFADQVMPRLQAIPITIGGVIETPEPTLIGAMHSPTHISATEPQLTTNQTNALAGRVSLGAKVESSPAQALLGG
jgi:hypothetical protein